MADLAKLVVRMEAESSKLTSEVEKANRKLDRFGKQTQSMSKKVTASFKAIGVAAVAFASGALVKNILNVNREFESLRASLITVTGSAEDADTAFKGIQDFAATTPYAVAEVTDAFIKLGNLGLAPSERALTSYGNTAGAMGKSLNQLVEAVADATTGEFERLKEFGIKSKSEGDRVTFTFKGVSTEIGKNAKEIQDFLVGLGETEFAGGMERQANTLNGAISNLGDSWDAFLDTILNEEKTSAVASAIRGLGGLVDWLNNKIAGESPISALSEQLRAEQKMLDEIIGEYNKPRVLRINPLISTEELGRRFDVQRDKVDSLKNQLSAMMITAGSASKSFDDIANSLDKVGASSTSDLSQTLMSGGDKFFMDEMAKTYEANDKLSESFRGMQSSLAEQRLELQMTGKELFVYQQIAELGINATDDMRASVTDLAATLYDEKQAMEELNKAADEQDKKFKDLQNTIEGWGREFADTMLDASSSFSDFAKNIVKQLAKIAVSKLSQPLFDAAGDFFSGMTGSLFGKATGGHVNSGQPYMVGERGPELFMPSTGGNIVPNSAMGAGGGVTQNISIDARGAQPGMEQKIRAAAEEGARKGYMMVLDDVRRNGAIRGALS